MQPDSTLFYQINQDQSSTSFIREYKFMSGLVTTEKLSEMTGYTKEAIRMKVKKGIWIKQQHYPNAPDGRLIFIVEMIYQWMRGE
jgi:hypothetical protein